MWKWINQHVTSVGQRKKLSPWQDSNIWPPTTWRALYPLELWRTHGERGHILGSYLTCIMHTARIMSMLYCVVKEWKMENFKLGELNVKMKSSCQERGPKKKSESPTGFEPMTFQKPGGGRLYPLELQYWYLKSWRSGLLPKEKDYRAALKEKTQTPCTPIIWPNSNVALSRQ